MSSHKHQGFSLLEILIAFTILAFSLTILLRIFSTGVNSAVMSEEYTAAVQIAESLMAKTGVESKPKNGQTSGVENDKYRWEVSVSPFNFVVGKFQMKSTAELFKVDAIVSWGDDDNDRQVRLTTLKLVNKEQ
ncbi:prepilin-type N-terminal cleavage/methylation domain-containing protein [Crenothrix sp.]|uniref:type IV pilus modification PilV family protein n=1 Tax=Crenothrix sp. TaxID=3100433 RepID=UPI00374CA5B0